MIHKFTLENNRAFYLKPLSKEEINEARLLCDECVGENLYGEEEIAAAIDSSDKFFYLLKSEAGENVGYIYYYLAAPEYIAQYSKLDPALFRKAYSSPGNKVGKIQSVGLKAGYRGIGLAARMISFILKHLKEIDIDAAFIVCWKPKGILPLGKALFECKFDYLAEAKKVWYDDTELICPYCNGRCLCDADVYYKLL
jgi:ribosomal protein S18 acetylase RimI-like enzyme